MKDYWKILNGEKQLDDILLVSKEKPVLVFKHSTRCSISDTALNRFESHWEKTDSEQVETYYLDLISFRNISNMIAELVEVKHESPQVLLLKDGKCIYHASHFDINVEDIRASLAK